MSLIPWAVMAAASGAVGTLNPIAQPGEPGYAPEPTHHVRVLFENDAAFGTDCNYTHGTRLDYARSLDPGKSSKRRDAWGVSLTQNIYTPETHSGGAVPGQHPYAGYLALGGGYMQRWRDFGYACELQLGTTGKPSFAENSQWFIHALGDMEQWDGWGDQVRSEVTFQCSARQDWRLPWLEFDTGGGWRTDASLFTREQVGTVAINAGAGVVFRWGKNLPPSMQASGNQPAHFGIGLLLKDDYNPAEVSYFVAASLYGGYYAHDFSIDGGVFHPFEQTCSRSPWQAEGQLGCGVSYQGIDYYAGGVFHSREYRTQDRNSLYGLFAITFHW